MPKGIVWMIVAAAVVAAALWYRYIINRYNEYFGSRFETDEDYYLYLSGLRPGWKREPISFPSDKAQILRGFLFSYELPAYRGLLVVVHGMDTSMDHYMPEIEYFCRRGFLVMSYDSTGTGRSDGKDLVGLPQSPIDLKYALLYKESRPDLNRYPLFLYGHSWGGFAVNAVSNYGSFPIRGIVSVSGFNSPLDVTRERAQRVVGNLANITMPVVEIHLFLSFGVKMFNTGCRGLARTRAKMLMLHSKDDNAVKYYHFEKYMQRFGHDPRFTFIPMDGRGHNLVTPPEVNARLKALYKQKKALEEQYAPAPVPEELLKPITDENRVLRAAVDETLMERFVAFYEDILGNLPA